MAKHQPPPHPTSLYLLQILPRPLLSHHPPPRKNTLHPHLFISQLPLPPSPRLVLNIRLDQSPPPSRIEISLAVTGAPRVGDFLDPLRVVSCDPHFGPDLAGEGEVVIAGLGTVFTKGLVDESLPGGVAMGSGEGVGGAERLLVPPCPVFRGH